MKFNIIIVIVAFFSYFSLTAQNAVEILDNVNKYYSSKYTIHAEFDITLEHGAENEPSDARQQESGFKDKFRGKLQMKGEKYKLTTDQLIRVCNGVSVWTHFLDDEEVLITDYEPEEEELSPAKIFSIYKEGYTSELIDKFKCGEGDCFKIELKPESPDNPYKSIVLAIDERNFSIKEAVAVSKNGTRMIFYIRTIDYNIDLADELFTYPTDKLEEEGVEVNDFR